MTASCLLGQLRIELKRSEAALRQVEAQEPPDRAAILAARTERAKAKAAYQTALQAARSDRMRIAASFDLAVVDVDDTARLCKRPGCSSACNIDAIVLGPKDVAFVLPADTQSGVYDLSVQFGYREPPFAQPRRATGSISFVVQ